MNERYIIDKDGSAKVLKNQVKDETAQLVYMDPPYFTGRDFGDFDDNFESISAYANDLLKPIFVESKRILKQSGTIVVHVESKVSHYVRMALDEVFGMKRFRNEIIWCSGGNKHAQKQLARFHDVLLVYTKTAKSVFNPLYVPYSDDYMKATKICKKTGKKYNTTAAHNSQPDVNPRLNLRYEWNGHLKQWYVTKEEMQRRHDSGMLEYSKSGIPRFIKYVDKLPGVPIRDLWSDIDVDMSKIESGEISETGSVWTDVGQIQNGEKMAYATQKPVKLLERIIQLYTNKGDLVVDPFAGSGTTGRAAAALHREYLLIDINDKGRMLFNKSVNIDEID